MLGTLTKPIITLNTTTSGYNIKLNGDSNEIQKLQNDGYPIRVGVASKTDEPNWAYICMEHMCLSDGTTNILSFITKDLIEISYGSKYNHIQRLHQTTGIPYNEMAFFDNEYWNIQDVQSKLPDVKCYYTPDGMTRKAWNDAMKDFNMDSSTEQ